jgi:hypothetical protein
MFGKSEKEILIENFLSANRSKLFLFVTEHNEEEEIVFYYRLSLTNNPEHDERHAKEKEWEMFC